MPPLSVFLVASQQDTRRAVPVGAWFLALALVVAGPLLGGGHLLLLDYPSGPQFPQVTAFPLPSSGDIGNGIPLLGALALLKEIHVFLPDKLLLIAPIVLGGTGVYRFVRLRLEASPFAAAYGGTLFVVNPFVYDRYMSGHLFFLLAYSLLPWALSPLFALTRRPSLRVAVAIALWFVALGAIDLHVLGVYALLTLLAASVAPSRLRLAFGAAAIGVGALASAYWFLPSLFTDPGRNIGLADVDVYASRPEGFAILPTLLGMDGFWRDEFTGPGERFSALYLLIVPILALAATGAVELLRPGTRRRFAVALSAGGLLGLILAAGSSFPPTADAFRWAFEHVPYMGAYREPQKFLALLILAYAVFGAVGLDVLVRARAGEGRRWLAPAAAAAAVTMALAYGYTMLWGFGGQVKPASYPASWAAADDVMDARGPGRLLVFPWHLYAVWSFTDRRIVANPAPSFFSREVLSGDEAGFRGFAPQSPDPFSQYIAELLSSRGQIRSLGHLVAPLGVRYVALLREVDWPLYRFVTRQQDLVPIYRGRRITLFENEAWRSDVFGLEEGRAVAAPSELFGSVEEQEVASTLFSSAPLVSVNDGGFPALAGRLPADQRVEATTLPFVTTTDRCSDGWRLGDATSTCDVGAVAAFASPQSTETLWRPLVGVQLVGYVLSGLTIVAAALYLPYSFRLAARGRV
jgi:hypothetical protein